MVALYIALPFLIASGLGLALCLLVWQLYRSPIAGVAAVLLLFLWETVEVSLFALNLGLAVYPQDLLFVCLGLAGALRLMRPGILPALPKSLWVLAAAMLLSFGIGLVQNGTLAGVEFRPDYYFFAGALYFGSFDWSTKELDGLVSWWMTIASAVLVVVFYRWIADATGLDWFEPVWRYADTTGVAFRVVNAAQTLFLGQAAVLLTFALAARRGALTGLVLLPVLVIAVLVLQHRSVWVAAFVPMMLAFVLSRAGRAQLALRLGAFVALTGFALAVLLATGRFSGVTASVEDSAVRAANLREGTFAGRVEGWQELLKGWARSGPRQYALGSPYGSGYARFESHSGSRKIGFAPHNYYVQTLLRSGLAGLGALLLVYLVLVRRLLRLGGLPHGVVSGYALVALLVSHLLFYIPYSPQYVQCIVLGVCLALVRRQAAEEVGGAAGEVPAGWITARAGV